MGVSSRRTTLVPIVFVLVSVSRLGRAEVLDKVAPPWEPSELVASLVVLAAVAALAATGKKPLWILALALALTWAFVRIERDAWFSEDVGPPLRAELSPAEGRVWLGTILAEGLLPGVVAVGVSVLQRKRDRR